MLRKIRPALWLALPLAYFLYFHQLTAVGLIGPDEPRFAAIARTMATSGDWITPRLLGKPWYEKPALLYWIEAVGYRVGLGPEAAPRLPVALLAVAFLALYWWILNREFGCATAVFATAILGTSTAWIVSSQIGTTDLPLAATYAAAMLLGLGWVRRRDPHLLPWVGAALGLAMLAKGPVAVVLAFPLLLPWQRPFWPEFARALAAFLRPRVVVPFLLVAAPWYVLCTWVNGKSFLLDFFWKHNVERYVSSTEVGYHSQPFYYFVPVLLALLLPWTPLLPLVLRRRFYTDPARLFLLTWAALWMIFFSISANKLPAYILPMVPAVPILLAMALHEVRQAAPWLAACAPLLIAFPIATPLLPVAVTSGITHAPLPSVHWTWFLPLLFAVLVWTLDRRDLRIAAVLLIATGATIGTVVMKTIASPQLDHIASGRTLHTLLGPQQTLVCIDWVPRGMGYSLEYYFVPPLPPCATAPRPLWLHQLAGQLPALGPPKRTK